MSEGPLVPPGALPPIAEADPERLAEFLAQFDERRADELTADDPVIHQLVEVMRRRVRLSLEKEGKARAGKGKRKEKGEGLPEEALDALRPRG